MSLVLLRMNKDSSYNNIGIGHLAWCALVALGIQRHDRLVTTEAQENIFLIRWLADARKQKRFPRNLTEHIDWLLAQGRRLGVRARLNQKLHYLWLISSGDLHNMPDLLRLTYAIEMAKAGGWQYDLVDEKKMAAGMSRFQNMNSFCLERTAIEKGFDSNGKLIAPLHIRVFGQVENLLALLDCLGLKLDAIDSDLMCMSFLRGRGLVSNTISIPENRTIDI